MATNEASDSARPPRSAAASRRVVQPAPVRRPSLLVSLGWAGAAPKSYTGNCDLVQCLVK